MKSNLFIPTKCKVGFNTREDTYTKKLGYIICFDGKKWRKEPSWEGWREKEGTVEEIQKEIDNFNTRYKAYIDENLYNYKKAETIDDVNKYIHTKFSKGVVPIEFENVATEGFVLNKKAGGKAGSSSSWNTRSTYCRVYDPRGWEFEITIPNLLYILENSSSFKGKGLEGKFLYSWDGKDLVLLPENAPEFKENQEFTALQSEKVSAKDLVKGRVYLTKQKEEVVYLGKYTEYTRDYKYNRGEYDYFKKESMKYWFLNKYNSIETKSGLSYLGKDTGKDDFEKLNKGLVDLEKEERFIGYGECILEEYKNINGLDRVYKDIYFKKGSNLFSFRGNLNDKVFEHDIELVLDYNELEKDLTKEYYTYKRDSIYDYNSRKFVYKDSSERFKELFPELIGKTVKELHQIYPLHTKKLKLKNGNII